MKLNKYGIVIPHTCKVRPRYIGSNQYVIQIDDVQFWDGQLEI